MAVSETIQELLQGIDEAQYGRDMREYIHKGIQKCYEEGSAGETDLVARNVIADVFGEIEDGQTASKAYNVNDTLIYDNALCKVIAAISEGDTFVEGTNIERSTIDSACMSTIYKLPYKKTSSSSVVDRSALFIIPSIRLAYLDIELEILNPTSITNKLTIGSELPIPLLAGSTLNISFVEVLHNETSITDQGYTELVFPKLSPNTSELSISGISSASGDANVYRGFTAKIIYLYKKLHPSHPLSGATVVEVE